MENAIFSGISSIGNLWPQSEQSEAQSESAWAEVWQSFCDAGDSMREAINEFARAI